MHHKIGMHKIYLGADLNFTPWFFYTNLTEYCKWGRFWHRPWKNSHNLERSLIVWCIYFFTMESSDIVISMDTNLIVSPNADGGFVFDFKFRYWFVSYTPNNLVHLPLCVIIIIIIIIWIITQNIIVERSQGNYQYWPCCTMLCGLLIN